jgi:type II secretory pathway predicted ATPase ExeA
VNGIILLDAALRPLAGDPESVRILAYPNRAERPEALGALIGDRILSILDAEELAAEGSTVAQLQSGKRRYLCRAFQLATRWAEGPPDASVALLLERGLAAAPAGRGRRARGLVDPFGFAPDPALYCLTRAHRDVLAALRTALLEGRGAVALLGQAGMGKTTLLAYLAGSLRRQCDIVHLSGPSRGSGQLARAVMGALGIEGEGSAADDAPGRLERGLVRRTLSGRRAAVIVDNAQELEEDALGHLVALAEPALGQQRLLTVILAGRPGLADRLAGRGEEAPGRRIGVYCRLTPMDAAETRVYVLHRLRLSGCAPEAFTPAALDLVALYSRGIPLSVNMLCRHSLSLAASIGLPAVDERIVEDSAYDLVLRSQALSPWDEGGGGNGSRAKPHLYLVKG